MPKREMNLECAVDLLHRGRLHIQIGAAVYGRSHRSAYWHEDMGQRTTSSGLGSSATTVESARITPHGDQREPSAIAAQAVEASRKS